MHKMKSYQPPGVSSGHMIDNCTAENKNLFRELFTLKILNDFQGPIGASRAREFGPISVEDENHRIEKSGCLAAFILLFQ